MLFKDAQYYAEKTKYYLGMALSALVVDAVIVLTVLFA